MASYCSRTFRVRGDDVNGQLLAGRQPGHRRLMHDKRLPHQTVFPKSRCSPKDGVPRKTVLAKRRGQESLRTMMPPSPLAAHGRVAFSPRRVASFLPCRRRPGRRRHADGSCGHDREPRLGHARGSWAIL
jgi:hypothetical protein